MKKIKNNQFGFGTVEVVLVLVIVVLLGVIGWYVYKNQNKTDKATSTKSNVTTTLTTKPKSTTNKNEKSFTFGSNKLYYVPPSGWTVKETPVSKYGDGQSGFVTLTSPDYKVTVDDNGGECSGTVTGKTIVISVFYPEVTNDTYIDKILNPAPGSPNATYTKNAKLTTMGGQKAVQYQHTPGECGYSTATSTVVNSYSIIINAASDENVSSAPYLAEPYVSIYNDVVNSVRF